MKILHVIMRFVVPGSDRETSNLSRVTLNDTCHVILSVAKNPVMYFLALVLFSLSACTDYEGIVDDKYEEWKATTEVISDPDWESSSSSSDVILSSSQNQQSSSSAKSSSSVASSSSAKSSSSVKDGSKYDATANTLTDLRDNQTYKTVTIGTQTWMAENLNYDYNEGTAKSYCYNNSADSCAKYGRLYLWSAAMDSAAVFSTAGKGCGYGVECKITELAEVRGVCPEGWHLPSKDEWNTLFTEVGGTSTAGTKLKSTSGWISRGNGTDAFGFSGLPAGYYISYDGDFHYVDYRANFWSSTENDSGFAYYMYLYYDDERAYLGDYRKYYARSVRCLRDSNDEGNAVSSSSIVSSSSAKNSSSATSSAKSSSSIVSSSSAIKDGSKYDTNAKTLTDLRDNQTYKTVTIGTQTWMAENLNIGEMVRGENDQEDDDKMERYCYDDDTTNCDKYGGLYQWAEAMQLPSECNQISCADKIKPNHQGICPDGWRLPDDDDWNALFTAVGGTSTAGTKLKSTSGWYSSGNGTDSFGFAVLPAGGRNTNGNFSIEGYNAYFWSSSEVNSFSAYNWSFFYNYEYVCYDYDYKGYGFPVRCLRDSN